VPADDVLTGHILEGTQVGPFATGQRQVSDVAHPHPVGLYGWRLVEQAVGGAAQPVGRIGGTRRRALGCKARKPRRRMAVRRAGRRGGPAGPGLRVADGCHSAFYAAQRSGPALLPTQPLLCVAAHPPAADAAATHSSGWVPLLAPDRDAVPGN